MHSDFDTLINREGTWSSKWDKYKDKDVIPMWVADMDFAAPEAVTQALHARVTHPIYGYTVVPDSLIEVIQRRLKTHYGWAVRPDDLALVPGVVPAINQVIRGVVSPSGAVVTAVPVYQPFLEAPGYMDRKLFTLAMTEKDGWAFPVEAFRALAEDRPEIELLLLCHPMNPVGRVLEATVLAKILEICLAHNIVICSDEIHCDLLLDGRVHAPMASISPLAAEQTITLQAASKTFNLAGLGCALVVAQNAALMAKFKAGGAGIMAHVNTLGYVATEAAWSVCDAWHESLLEYLTSNRDYLRLRIADIPGVSIGVTEATYLAWLNVTELALIDPQGFFELAGVGLSAGTQFGADGYMRLNFGCSRRVLETGLDRIQVACEDRVKALQR
ncbi:MAG: PatB family C-S lyase [Pseudomonadales bacterium]